jgi:hypothetical protein
MGKINPENLLQFKSSQPMFDRISKRLNSFDSMQLIDTGDFHKHVAYILEELGQAVYSECEAIIPIKDHYGKLPDNFKIFHAAFKCKSEFRSTKTINEQKPWIFMIDTEITKECPNKCKFEHKHESGTDKIVIRTFVNADDPTPYQYSNPILLRLSPNVRTLCTDDCPSLFTSALDEITIDDKGIIHTHFTDDSIYLQYYGLPIDENGLPMIPVNEAIEKAIEYYIYTQLFEEFYWNSAVPNIGNMLQDARAQADFHLAQARYWSKLPSFQKMINSVRRARSRRKFFYSIVDRTIV